MSTIRYTDHSVFTRAFRANFSLSFPRNNDRLFPEKYTVKFSLCPKSERKYWASAPVYTMILLKSNKFNMAALSVKSSIHLNGHTFQDCIIYGLKRAFVRFC